MRGKTRNALCLSMSGHKVIIVVFVQTFEFRSIFPGGCLLARGLTS